MHVFMKTLASLQDFCEILKGNCLLWADIREITPAEEALWRLAVLIPTVAPTTILGIWGPDHHGCPHPVLLCQAHSIQISTLPRSGQTVPWLQGQVPTAL